MISLMLWYYERDLDDHKREDFRNMLDRDDSYVKPPRRHLKAVKDLPEGEKEKFVPVGRFKAPPGWKPPGWNEERSYKQAMSFMQFQRDPK